MAYLKPSPQDDRTPTGWFDGGNQNGSSDDDDAALRPFFGPRLRGAMRGVINSFYPSYAPLDGAYFRVGYQFYTGICNPLADRMQHAESDSTIGRPTIMRPPIIPRRSVGPAAVRDAINFVQSMPYESWGPIVPPPVARR